jgi:hypothetical protein
VDSLHTTTRVSAVTATCYVSNDLTRDSEAIAAKVRELGDALAAQNLLMGGPAQIGIRLSDEDNADYFQNKVALEVTQYAYSGYLKSMADDAAKWRELQKNTPSQDV